jgi:hypothetical protein
MLPERQQEIGQRRAERALEAHYHLTAARNVTQPTTAIP